MQFIDNEEDFQGLQTFSYAITFEELDDEQKQYLIDHFDDYSWEMGLAITKAEMTSDGSITTVKFESIKEFTLKDEEDWNEDDLEENLLTILVGSGQFFSSIYFADNGIDGKKVAFESDGKIYAVDISKSSDISL